MPNLTGIKIIPLPIETITKTGFNYVIEVDYTAVALMTSTTAQAIFPINALAAATAAFLAGFRVERCAARVKTAFVFAPGTLALDFGDDGDVNRLLSALDLKTAAYAEGPIATMPATYNAANTLDIIVTAGAGALTSVTAGVLEIYLGGSDLSSLSSGVPL